ncbi:polymorphic toxin-type HINT domain-containing protein [Kitasatospora sp. NBC_01560]|uniref:polymorphic toxin-type HINT domain-containing protein n=1 Tax=Kitasatospora sp. NBC_01560 TaxID=2975965 RepID=UPI00386D7DF6
MTIPSAQAVAEAVKEPAVWVPPNTPLPQTTPVKGSAAKVEGHTADRGRKWSPPGDTTTPSGAATTALGDGASAGAAAKSAPAASAGAADAAPAGSAASPVQVGTLPVWIGQAQPSSAAPAGKSAQLAPLAPAGAGSAQLKVEVADADRTRSAGVSGALISLADAGAGAVPGRVQVGIDTTAWAKAAGANWGSRARVVQLPGCALTTPGAPGCTTRTPVASHRDGVGRLVAEVDVPQSAAVAAKSLSPSAFAAPASASPALALAVEAGPSGSAGDFSASPLTPSASWQAGANAANFTYGYTVELPSALGGSAPSVSLGYDSSAVDGKTASTNAQPSWIGDGWDWQPGAITRGYKGCKDAGVQNSGDQCWGGDLLSLSLAGHAGQLVRDDTSCVWHLQGEDGTKVERLTDQNNGAWKGEAWRVTTVDGTQFYFGANHLPGGDGSDQAANSVSTVPVYWPGGQDPCLKSGSPATNSWSQMGWQWSLDYVVDPHQNLITYRYEQEQNSYARGGGQNNGNGTRTQYQRASYPVWVGYGQRLPEQIAAKGKAKPAAQVWFRTDERCLPSGQITCDPSQRTKANAKSWPDTPVDQTCDQNGTCEIYSPTFWTSKRLTKIDTEVWDGSAYRAVDSFALKQSFQDPGDGTSPALWLDSVQRTGSNGRTPITLPEVAFQPLQIPNRVDGDITRPDGTHASVEPYKRPRIQKITTETGGVVNIVYKGADCSRVAGRMPSSEDDNKMACMPVKWYLPGQSAPDPVNDWFNKIVVESVTQQDAVAGATPTVTTYEYGGGAAWHRNDSELTDPKTRTWDQFRGFATVTTRGGSGSSVEAPRTRTISTFLRGMDGDVLANGSKRTADVADVHGGSIKDENVLAGYIRDTTNYDADNGNIVSTVVSDPWLGPVTATRNQSGGMPAITARAVNTAKVTTRTKLVSGWRTNEQSTAYDTTLVARPTVVVDNPDTAHPEQARCSQFSYADGPGGAVTQLASRVLLLSGACNQTPTKANTIADTRSYFDNLELGKAGSKAEQTATEVLESYDATGKAVYRFTARAAFDDYGRVTSTKDPTRTDDTHATGAETKTAYAPATGQLPTQITHTNPLGWQNVTTLDVGRALPVKAKDENNRISEQDYDALGRVVAAWSPDNDRAKNPTRPNRKFSYALNGANAPSTVLTQALLGDLKTYTSSFTIYDGLGRIRQTQASTPSGVAGRMITDALFDSHGWQTKTSAAYYTDQGDPSGALFLPNGGVNPDGKIPAQTVRKYDGMGRVTDSVFQSYGIEQWRSRTEYAGADETRSIPPAGGYASASITDARGQGIALRQYKANTPTGPYDETTYGYTVEGQEAWRKDAAGNVWTHEYDLLGRLLKSTDPDSGSTTLSYNDAKNTSTGTDARGRSATSVTDLLGRTVASYEGPVADSTKQVGAWTYDTLALGKPTSGTRYVGGVTGKAYKSEVTGYDTGYRVLGTKTTIPQEEGKLAGTYTTTNTYDAAGRLQNSLLPAVPNAGLAAEKLTFASDTVGHLAGLSSVFGFGPSTTYVADLRYDPYGRIIRTTLGRGGANVVSTTMFDNSTGRVTRSILDKENAPTASVDVNDYTYNALGQVTSVRNAQDGQVADLQCYNHDYLGRLTQAWTDTGTQTTAAQPSIPGLGACTNANGPAVDAGKPSVGGPAPYWQQYEYDLIGNRTKLVQKDVNGDASKDVTTTQTFGPGTNTAVGDPKNGVGTGGPHALVRSTRTGPAPAAPAVTSYTYDMSGNTASITSTSGTKSLTWNDQGKLDKVTGTGESNGTSYLYDTSGNQLIRRDTGRTTLNLGGDQITFDTVADAVTDVRSYPAAGGLTITRTTTVAGSRLAYQGSDPHGTNSVQFDASTLAQVRRPTDPFGNERGAQPAPGVWAGDKGFVGGTKESATGFTLLGAREYDPRTARFLSPDPIVDSGDPQQWNAYAYANNSPVNRSDANGLRQACDTPAECQGLREWEAEQRKGSAGTPPTPTPTPAPSADEQKAQDDKNAADKIVNEGKRKRDEIKHQVVDLIGDLIGYNDARDCFTKGDVMACVNTALNAVPWGKLFKAIKVGIKAFKVYKEIDKAYDVIRAGERAAADAEKAIVRAKSAAEEARAAEKAAAKAAEEKAAKETAGDAPSTEPSASKAEVDSGSAAPSCNSFPAGTQVLMADGTVKPIEQVVDGDVVMATDPQTGETAPETVTTTITTPDDKDFTDLTLAGESTVITSTHHHPYWSETRKQWVDAGELTVGEELRKPDGSTSVVRSVRNYLDAVVTHNLTVDRVHTYYVVAGATPLLVHNCNGANVHLSEVGADGRAGVAYAEVSPQVLADAKARTIGSEPSQGKRNAPAEFIKLGGGNAGWSKGHLIGRQFGGSGKDLRNIVTQTQAQNNGPIATVEDLIAKHVENTGNTVIMSVTPHYDNPGALATRITIEAVDDFGWTLKKTLSNL